MNFNKLVCFLDEFWYYYKYAIVVLILIALIITGTVLSIQQMHKNMDELKSIYVNNKDFIEEIEQVSKGMEITHKIYVDDDKIIKDEYYDVAYRR